MSTTANHQDAATVPPSDATEGNEGGSLAPPSPLLDPAAQEGRLLLRVEKGVRIFFIPPGGEVFCPEEETFLEVVTFINPPAGSAEGFLQVGEWLYPLVRGQSPALLSSYRSFIFPELEDTKKIKQFVGVVLPNDVTQEIHQQLVDLLSQFAHLTKQEASDGVDGAKMEKTIQIFTATTKMTTSFVLWGSTKMCEVIQKKSDDIQEASPRAGEDPSSIVKEVDPRLLQLGEKAVTASKVTVRISNTAVAQVNRVTAWLAKTLTPTVQDTAARVISGATGKPKDPDTLLTGDTGALLCEAVKSSSSLCKAMERAALLLASSISDNTVKVVQHVYGPEAGELANSTCTALLQAAATGHNVSRIGTAGIAKQTAKEVAKAMDKNSKKK